MIITTIDPVTVTGQKILHPEKHPFVVEGYGYAETRQRYLANESHDIYALAQSRDE